MVILTLWSHHEDWWRSHIYSAQTSLWSSLQQKGPFDASLRTPEYPLQNLVNYRSLISAVIFFFFSEEWFAFIEIGIVFMGRNRKGPIFSLSEVLWAAPQKIKVVISWRRGLWHSNRMVGFRQEQLACSVRVELTVGTSAPWWGVL